MLNKLLVIERKVLDFLKSPIGTSGLILSLLGIFSFFQGSVAEWIDEATDEGYIFKSDITTGIVLILIGLILVYVSQRLSKKVGIISMRTVGIFYLIISLCSFNVSGYNPRLFGIFAVDARSAVLYLIIGIILTVVGFRMKQEIAPMNP